MFSRERFQALFGKQIEALDPKVPEPIREIISAPVDDDPADNKPSTEMDRGGGSENPLTDWKRSIRATSYAVSGEVVQLQYVNGHGKMSDRRVKVGRLLVGDDGLYLRGYCFERRAERTFADVGIVSLTCLGTGEEFTDIDKWLAAIGIDLQHLLGGGPDPLRQWRKVDDGVAILMFLARYDGTLHPTEEDVLRSFIVDRLAKASEHEIAACHRRAMGQFPGSENLEQAINYFTTTSAKQVRALIAHLDQLIAADGVIDPKEQAFRDAVVNAIESERHAERARASFSRLVEPS